MCSYPDKDADKELILFLADSRGFGLGDYLHKHLTASFTILPYSGATLTDSVHKSIHQLREVRWTQVYLLSGLCSITYKDASTKRVSLRQEDPAVAVQALKSEVLYCINTIRSTIDSAKIKCIVAPITGMDLKQYNNNISVAENDTQQTILNEIIIKANEFIVDINAGNCVPTPWTSRLVHKRNRGSFVHNYALLAKDGCHLSDRLRLHWASALSDAVTKNSHEW